MKKRNLVLITLFISLFLHALFIFFCSYHIEAKGSPAVYVWLNVITENDLFSDKGEVNFPAGVNFSTDQIRKEYFSSLFLTHPYFSKDKNNYKPAISLVKLEGVTANERGLRPADSYLYLWEKANSFYPQDEEVVPYNAFVSSRGKVLFMYPEKLPVNSYGNLSLQEYIRNASFFLNEKFFWTKLEGVVK